MPSALKRFLWSIPGVDAALCYTSAALAQRRRARGDAGETYGGGKTQNARYCYSVWMRHLVSACATGGVPKVVAEIGPGRSVGCGIAARAIREDDIPNLKRASSEIRAFSDMLGLSPLARSRIGLMDATTVKTAADTAAMFAAIDDAYGEIPADAVVIDAAD